MISVKITKNRNGLFQGIECNGHAEYDEYGNDIICSAVSMLVINTVNSIEELAKCKIHVDENDKDGYLKMTILEPLKDESLRDASLFIESLILGINQVIKNYSKKYVKLEIQEV